MPTRYLHALMLLLFALPLAVSAQNIIQQTEEEENHFLSDSLKVTDVPEGIYAWTVDGRFGIVQPAAFDTIPHLFQNEAYTDGMYGQYNFLGNLGSPRLSRIFTERKSGTFNGQYIFADPYDFFLTQPDQLLFTNTKSPFTNLTYHECGGKQTGEDRFRALFAVNVNKRLGLGFKIDYLYGRGYYDSQSTSQFNATVWGSYRGRRYQLHTAYFANHLKTAENGGIESDNYINSPESYPTKYGTRDYPVNLNKTYNKQDVNTFFLTHRLNFGFTRQEDENGNIVRIKSDKGTSRFATIDRKETEKEDTDSLTLHDVYIPVASIFHTMRFDHNNRRFMSNASALIQGNYFNDFYLPGDSTNDYTRYYRLDNTLGLELHEGMTRWLKTGLRLFARYEFYKYTLPQLDSNGLLTRESTTEHYLSLGAQLYKEQGTTFRYHLLGELRSTGRAWGQFNVEADATLQFPFLRDTLRVMLDGYIRNEQPSFYLRHYHGRNAWWDNDLGNQWSIRAGGRLSWKETALTFHIENIRRYAYFQENQTPYTASDGTQRATYGVSVAQKSGSLQLITASLSQNLAVGPLHWDNVLTFQATTDRDALPLPAFNLYTNLYLKFRFARVLDTEIGADMRFFTRYYAPTYSPIIGQYASQDLENRIKLGSYPIINVYANFHLKRTRFYVAASHVNYSNGAGRPFLVPHHPLNRFTLRLGVSWNFIN